MKHRSQKEILTLLVSTANGFIETMWNRGYMGPGALFNGYRVSFLQDGSCEDLLNSVLLNRRAESSLALVVSDSLQRHGLYSPGSSVQAISQARLLQWAAIPFSRGFSRPRDRTHVSYISFTGSQVPFH